MCFQPSSLRVGVNLFAAQFRPANLAELVRAELKQYGLPARLIAIEVTESTAVKGSQRIIAELAALRQQGVGIALDDFATGYASLSLLKEMPLNRLKIDKGFVREMAPGSCDAAVVDAVLRMRPLPFDRLPAMHARAVWPGSVGT